MADNLPVRSERRTVYPVSRERPITHVRKLASGRKVIVNKNLRKKKHDLSLKTPLTTMPPKQSGEGGSKMPELRWGAKTGLVEKVNLPPREMVRTDDWKKQLKTDTGEGDLGAKIHKWMKRDNVKLFDGETLVYKLLGADWGGFEFIYEDGEIDSASFGPHGYSMREEIIDAFENPKNFEPFVLMRDEMFGFPDGIRPAIIEDEENKLESNEPMFSEAFSQVKPGVFVLQKRSSSGQLMQKEFKSYDDWEALKKKNAKKGLDEFGLRLNPQAGLGEFK